MEVMARPKKEGMDYFPHDVYASSDEKIEPLLLLYGAAGYAFYFLHLEYIYRSGNFEFDVSAAETRQILGTKLGLCQVSYDKILQTAFDHGLFDQMHHKKTGRLTSNGIKKRAQIVVDKRNRMRQARESKAEKVTAAQTEPQTLHKPSKGKERKEKNIYVQMESKNDSIERFNEFWKAYPRKEKKKEAMAVWMRKGCGNGLFEPIMEKLEVFKGTEQWAKNNGQFIPLPSSWLNGERWNDEIGVVGGTGQKVGGYTF